MSIPVPCFALISIECLNVVPVSDLFDTTITGCENRCSISLSRFLWSGTGYPHSSVGSMTKTMIVAKCLSASIACFSMAFLFSSGLSSSPGVSTYWFPSAS